MTDHMTKPPCYGCTLLLSISLAVSFPAQATDWNAVSRGLNQMGQQLQTYSEQQRRREQEQERLRLQQEQLELQRQKIQAAEKERQQAQQLVRDAEQRVIQGERAASAEADKAKRLAEQTPPDGYSGRIAFHRNALKRASVNVPPLMTIPNTAHFSPDGTNAVWIEVSQGVIKRWDMTNNMIRSIAVQRQGKFSNPHFVGNNAISVQIGHPDWSALLIDLEGQVVRAWPTNTHTGYANDRSFTVTQVEEGKATKISLIDAKGAMMSEVDLRGVEKGADQATDDGFHVITRKGRDVQYFRDGQLIRQFSGDSRRHPTNEYQTPFYSFVHQTPSAKPYAVSTMVDDTRFMLWDLDQGRLVCTGIKPEKDYSIFIWPEGSTRVFLHSSPPAAVDPATCGVQIIGGPGDRLSWTKERAFLANSSTGRVSEIDPVSFQVKRSFDTGLSRAPSGDHEPYMFANTDRRDPKTLVVTLGQYGKPSVTQLHDVESGRLIATVPTWTPVAKTSDYVYRSDWGDVMTTRIWQRSALFDPQLDSFLKSAAKDGFETTETWRKRVAALGLPYRIALELDHYDADQGRFDARFKGVPMRLPVPPEVARTLAGAKTVELEGNLKVLDTDFFELADAKVLLPEGKVHTIVPKVCPKTLANYFQLRAFQHPRLAALRKQILATSVTETIDKARRAGFDRQTAITATLEQRNLYADEGQQIAATKDPEVASDLRNIDKLPLDYSCRGPKKEPVCRYIEQMWRAMAAEAIADAMDCR